MTDTSDSDGWSFLDEPDGDPWPELDATPFAHEPRSADDVMASLQLHSGLEWYVIARAYFEAGVHLHNVVADGDDGTTPLAFPTAFVFRQAIELALKECIRDALAVAGRDLPVDPALRRKLLSGTHDLKELGKYLTRILHLLWPDHEEDNAIGRLRSHLAQWHQVDPSSTAFRYPVDRDDAPNPKLPSRVLNLTLLADATRAVLTCIDAVGTQLQVERELLEDLATEAMWDRPARWEYEG